MSSTTSHDHPTRQRLKLYLLGELPADEAKSIEDHLDGCDACVDQLADVDSNDAVVDAIRELDAETRITLPDQMNSDTNIGIGAFDLPPKLGVYETRGLLGRGGMGVVVRARDPKLDRPVAIKVLSPQMVSNSVASKRFMREAQAAAAVNDPHVVTIYAVDEQDGLPYLVMECVEGVTLHDKIGGKARMPIDEIVRVSIQVARGLAAAHKRDLIHRDIKPSNILLEQPDERVKITDFGLARAVDDVGVTKKGHVVGTPEYMSPEQANGAKVDHRSDLFSLGTLMYAMCSGRSPFTADSSLACLRLVVDWEPSLVHDVNPNVPLWLSEVIHRLLQKEPNDRYQDAEQLADWLDKRLENWEEPPSSMLDAVDDPAEQANPTLVITPGEITPTIAQMTPGGPLSRGAERRWLTVIQCEAKVQSNPKIDDPEDTNELHRQELLLAEFHRMCTELMVDFQGHLIESGNNSILFCIGYPIAAEDATARAAHFGCQLLANIDAFNARIGSDDLSRLFATVAVHSDLIVVRPQSDQTISIAQPMLDTLQNLSDAAQPQTLLTTESTWQLIQQQFDGQPLDVPAGARGGNIIRVDRSKPVSTRMELFSSDQLSPLIGRDREVELLAERWQQACEGIGQVVLVTGDAGLGKSRLVHTLKENVLNADDAALANRLIFEWRCAPQHQHSSLHPAAEYFSEVLGFERGDTAHQRLQRMTDYLSEVNSEEIGLLASMLSIPLGDRSKFPSLNPAQQKERTFALLEDWVCESAQVEPLLFIVEDLHWADAATLEFLQQLAESIFDERVLILLTCRPEFAARWDGVPDQTQISLTRMTSRQIADLVVQKSGTPEVPQHVLDEIASRTDGVPLFVEEFTQMFIDSEILTDRWVNDLAAAAFFRTREIPATLHDLLLARLDRLTGDWELAQLASVIGREFTYDQINAASDLSEELLQIELEKLIEAELLIRRGRPPRARFTFKHVLLQDAAYNSMLADQRKTFHDRVGKSIEQDFPDQCDNQPEVLAHHFTEGADYDRAAEYWQRAGRRSMDLGGHREAIGHLTRSLEMLERLPESPQNLDRRLQLHVGLGPALQSVRGYGALEVEQNYELALDLCNQLEATPHLFSVLYGMFRVQLLRAQYDRAEVLCEQLVKLADVSGDDYQIVSAHRALGAPRVFKGRHANALTAFDKVFAIEPTPEMRSAARQYDVVDPWVTARSYSAISLWLHGLPDQALAACEAAVKQAERLKHPFSLALALAGAQWVYQFLGDFNRTRDTAARALEICKSHGFGFWVGWCQIMHGWAEVMGGQNDAGLAEMQTGLEGWKSQGSKLGLQYFYSILAEAYVKSSQPDRAIEMLAKARNFSKRSDEHLWTAETDRLEGEIRLQQGDLAAAETLFDTAHQQSQDQQALSLELRSAVSLARMWHSQGKTADGKAILEKTLVKFTEGKDTPDWMTATSLRDEKFR